MRKFARIENNVVRELFDLDDHHPERTGIDGLFHPALDWRSAPPGCAEGWVLHEDQIVAADDYRVRRVKEYPPLMEFIDGMVKVHSPNPAVSAEGDAQVSAYCDAALAVKAKYLKATG